MELLKAFNQVPHDERWRQDFRQLLRYINQMTSILIDINCLSLVKKIKKKTEIFKGGGAAASILISNPSSGT